MVQCPPFNTAVFQSLCQIKSHSKPHCPFHGLGLPMEKVLSESFIRHELRNKQSLFPFTATSNQIFQSLISMLSHCFSFFPDRGCDMLSWFSFPTSLDGVGIGAEEDSEICLAKMFVSFIEELFSFSTFLLVLAFFIGTAIGISTTVSAMVKREIEREKSQRNGCIHLVHF